MQSAQFDIVKYLVQEGAKPDCSVAVSYTSEILVARVAYLAKKYSTERFYNTIGLLLDAGGELPHNILIWDCVIESISKDITPNVSRFRHFLFYVLHHESSSLMPSDLLNSSEISIWLWGDFRYEEAHVWERSWVERFQLLLELGYNFASFSGMEYSVLKPGPWPKIGLRFGSQMLRLYLQNGMDPCGLSFKWATPITHTHLFYYYDTLAAWFEALYDCGISIEAVARHTLEYLSGLTSSCLRQLRRLSSDDHCKSIETVRADLLGAFAEHGCYIDPSEDFTPKREEKSNATGADFKPSTVYDAERAKVDVRRRKGTRVQEIDVED